MNGVFIIYDKNCISFFYATQQRISAMLISGFIIKHKYKKTGRKSRVQFSFVTFCGSWSIVTRLQKGLNANEIFG